MNLFDYAESKPAQPFAIKRGIPIPSTRDRAVKATWERPVFDFKSMEVGDCFDVWPHECGGEQLIVVQNFVSGQAAAYRKKSAPEKQFTTRQIQGQFVRCWRVR